MSKPSNIFKLIFCFITLQTQAQGWFGNSPYSSFGVGEVFSHGYSAQQGIGGAGVASPNNIYTNGLNPALLAGSGKVNFEVGLVGNYKKLSGSGSAQTDVGANLNYLALTLPAHKKWTIGLGLSPYSSVDYDIRQTAKTEGSINSDVVYSRRGEGSLSKANISNGVLLGKSLYLGVETNFYFGNIKRESTSRLLLGDGQDYELSLTDHQVFGGAGFKFGANYRQKLNKDWFLNVGGTFEPQNGIRSSRIKSYQTSVVSGDESQIITNPDTLKNYGKGSLQLPAQSRIGFTLERPYKLYFSVDYMNQDWTKYLSFDNKPETAFRKSNALSVGLEYFPNVFGTGYFNKVGYRLGFNNSNTPYSIKNEQIKDRSVSLGLGFPMRNSSTTHLSAALGRRGSGTTVQENYVRFSLGFTLSDGWFQKFKID